VEVWKCGGVGVAIRNPQSAHTGVRMDAIPNREIRNCLVLAGGLGTRLRSAVADRPKVLAEIRGRPFLAYLLDRLSQGGIRRVILCTGYRGEQVEAAFGSRFGALELVYSREPEALGTGGALRHAASLLEPGPALVLNGDSFCEVDYQGLAAWHRERGACGSLALTRVEDPRRYGSVETDADGRVTRFVEKHQAAGPGWINAGVYVLGRELLESIPEGRAISLEREVFPAWIGRGLHACRCGGRFLDIGTPESYAEAERFFAGAPDQS
jgi:NDP-sugar pyrophosphorylase family protein